MTSTGITIWEWLQSDTVPTRKIVEESDVGFVEYKVC